jgi:drug/metabolite transporter (DMT)-like permease
MPPRVILFDDEEFFKKRGRAPVMSLRAILAPKAVSVRRANIEALMCVLFWSASFASMKFSVREFTPFLAVWFRTLFGLMMLAPAAAYRNELRLPKHDEIVPLVILALLGIVLHHNIQFAGMKSAGVANSNWLVAAAPVFVAVLGWIFLKERLNPLGIIGLAVSAIGVMLVVGLGTEGLGIFRIGGGGDVLIAISTITWAVFQILSRRFARLHPTFTLFWMNVFALAAQTLLVLFAAPRNTSLLDISVAAWCAVVFMGCVNTGLCYILWYDSLSVLPAVRVTAFQSLQPVFGILVAYFLAGERFTVFAYLGGGLALIGIWMINNRNVPEGDYYV